MKKSTVVFIVVFVVVFITVFCILQTVMNSSKYSCYDYENNVNYTFKTEEEMHEVCDEINGVNDDNTMNSYSIYEELISEDDKNGFSFDPYVRNDELVIIVAITDCDNPEQAKEKARQWFENHYYDINSFTIEYENPCNG